MRSTLIFFTFLFICLMLAALLTPPLLATGWLELEPQRVMSRLAQLLMLIGSWPLLRTLALTQRSTLGYGVTGREWRRSVGRGWLYGVAMLLAVVLMLLALEIRLPEAQVTLWPDIFSKTASALLGGLLIGLLEETFFRGALYGAIRRRDGMRAAVLWSALLYAAVHFLKPGALPDGMAFDSAAAFWMLTHVFIDALSWQHLDSFTALFCSGILLALLRERSGHLGWCIGLHAGWVWVIQLTRWLTDGNPTAPLAVLVGAYDGIIGWLAALWISGVTAIYWHLMPRPAPIAIKSPSPF